MVLAKVTPINPNNPIPIYGVEKIEKTQTAAKAKPMQKAKPKVKSVKKTEKNASDLNLKIATRAYYKAEARGFAPGYEMQDWLAAEAEINNGSR